LLVCNAWSLDHEPLNAGRQKLSVQDFEHVPPWLALLNGLTHRTLSGMRGQGGCDIGHS
jgi:hypothetical protein